jgi:tRNA uridine 5-carboxymethylaminomethyl modification enzyme
MLRSDNANDRLAALAHAAGLIDGARFRAVTARREAVDRLITALGMIRLNQNSATTDMLAAAGLPAVSRGMTALEYARRPDVALGRLLDALRAGRHPGAALSELDADTAHRAEVTIKYQAYVEKELLHIDRARRMEDARLPLGLDYAALPGLRSEAREKLRDIRPATIGQASRIAGVTPGDIAVLLVYLKRSTTSTTSPIARDTAAREPIRAS